MGLFKKTAVEPTTVTEAIQPFRDVQANLVTVLGKASARKAEAQKRTKDAKARAAQIEADEKAAEDAADIEILQADKIATALATLLGDEEVRTSGLSKSESARAKKIADARNAGTDSGEGLRKGPDAE